MKLRILIVALVVLAGFGIYLSFSRSNPVLYRQVDRASVQYSAFIIQNPFRDREPERNAGLVLESLKRGSCQQALSLPALNPARIEHLCEGEQKYPLVSWSVMDRKGEAEKQQLIYNVYRNQSGGIKLGAPVWINLQKINGEWQVTSYETYY